MTEELPMLELGILDLCKRGRQRSAGEALHGTLALAMEADRLGYRRYWVAEHHVEDSAEACPEVLIPLIAGCTKRITVGSGGVLLRYYSPLKVAETFLTIEALFPGRIELGVCKGPGVTQTAVADALVGGNRWELTDEAFERKVFELSRLLANAHEPSNNSTPGVRARPYGVPPPPLWVLGSGSKSQQLASDLGCSYACALMFPGGMALGPKVVADYRRGFVAPGAKPRACIALSVIAEESEAKANVQNRAFVSLGMMESNVVGTPEQCAARIEAIAGEHQASEVLLASWHEDPAERIATYRRLANAMKLTERRSTPSEQPVCESVE
jgi:luciferase family oxidoreductase group 1